VVGVAEMVVLALQSQLTLRYARTIAERKGSLLGIQDMEVGSCPVC